MGSAKPESLPVNFSENAYPLFRFVCYNETEIMEGRRGYEGKETPV